MKRTLYLQYCSLTRVNLNEAPVTWTRIDQMRTVCNRCPKHSWYGFLANYCIDSAEREVTAAFRNTDIEAVAFQVAVHRKNERRSAERSRFQF